MTEFRSLAGRGARRVVPQRIRPALRLAWGRLQALRYRGDAVECLCCGWNGTRFPIRTDPRGPSKFCPRCYSVARHRLLALHLPDRLHTGTRLLHIAPEPILQRRFKKMPLIYTTADLVRDDVDMQIDMTQIPLPDGSFDAVMALHVLEHIPEDSAAIGEAFRVLTPGGFAVLQSAQDAGKERTDEYFGPLSESERIARFEGPDHVRLYGRDFGDRLRETGFHVTERPVAESFAPETIDRHGLDPAEIFYDLRRPA